MTQRTTALTIVAGIVSATLAGVAAAPPAAATWRPNRTEIGNLTDSAGLAPSGPDSGSGHAIESAGSSGQKVAVAWRDTRGGDPYTATPSSTDIELRESFDGGNSWGSLLNVSHAIGRQSVEWPDLAMSGDATVVAAASSISGSGGASSLDLYTVADSTGHVTNTSFPTDAIVPRVAGNRQGSFYAVVGSPNPVGVTFTASHDDGQTWAPPAALVTGMASDDGGPPYPDVSADGTNADIAWSGVPDPNNTGSPLNDVYVVASTDSGATFSTPYLLAATPYSESDPAVATHGNTVVVAWLSFQAADKTVLYSDRSTDAGITWEGPQQVALVPAPTGQRGTLAAGTLMSYTGGNFVLSGPDLGTNLFTSPDGATWSHPNSVVPGSDVAAVGGQHWFGSGSGYTDQVNDTAAPTVKIAGVPTKPVDGRARTLTIDVADADSSTVTVTCTVYPATKPWQNCPSAPPWAVPAKVTMKVPRSGEGKDKITVTATDQVGNRTKTVKTWIVDSYPPTVTVTPPILSNGRAALSWKAVDRGAGVAYSTVRYRSGHLGGPLGSWRIPSTWRKIRPKHQHVSQAMARSTRLCFSVRAQDKTGKVSSWTKQLCLRRS